MEVGFRMQESATEAVSLWGVDMSTVEVAEVPERWPQSCQVEVHMGNSGFGAYSTDLLASSNVDF